MSLRVLGEACQDLLINLFIAYQTVLDNDFRNYIRDQQSKWVHQEIANLTVDTLTARAEGRYKVAMETGAWAKPTKEEADLIALTALLDAMVANQAEGAKPAGGAAAVATKTRKASHGPRPKEEGDWAWKNTAPTGNQPKEKTFKNKVYIACKFHKSTQWVLKAFMHDNVWPPFILSMSLVLIVVGSVYLPKDYGNSNRRSYVLKRHRKWARFRKELSPLLKLPMSGGRSHSVRRRPQDRNTLTEREFDTVSRPCWDQQQGRSRRPSTPSPGCPFTERLRRR